MDLSGRRVIICDPMLATGGSLVKVCDLVKQRGATHIHALLPYRLSGGPRPFLRLSPFGEGGVRRGRRGAERVGFTVPGLGDAGDRLFGLRQADRSP